MNSLVSFMVFPALLLVTAAADGGPSKPADVTGKVKAAVKENKLSLSVNGQTLGVSVDADPPKLRITYQFTNRVRTRCWADGQTASIAVPEPQPLTITRAEYGQFDDPVDVTPLIAGLVKNNAIPPSLIEDETMFVDPNHGVTKQLVVRYAIDGKQKMMNVEQNEELKIAAPADGKKLTIIEATYGLPANNFDVTDMVADMAKGPDLTLTPTDELFGDPGPGLSGKKLEVTYVQDGQTTTVSADSGKSLNIVTKGSSPLLIVKAIYGVILK